MKKKKKWDHSQAYKMSKLGQAGKIDPALEYVFDSRREILPIQLTGWFLGLFRWFLAPFLLLFKDFRTTL